MAVNPYVNKVMFGNQTVMDISDTDAQESDVANGKVFYKASGQRSTGIYVPSGTPLTPSNSSPAAMTSGNDYHATANGYAIESYTSKTPSSTPSAVSNGDIVKAGGNGHLIDSYDDVTPSSSGTYVSTGMKRLLSSGYVYDQKPKSLKVVGAVTHTGTAKKTYTCACDYVYVMFYSQHNLVYGENGRTTNCSYATIGKGETFYAPDNRWYVTLASDGQSCDIYCAATSGIYTLRMLVFLEEE